MRRITNRAELLELKKELGMRDDWHEPSEQGVTAQAWGSSFDNAGFWPAEHKPYTAPEIMEQYVVVSSESGVEFAVNLATLFAWASESRSVAEDAVQKLTERAEHAESLLRQLRPLVYLAAESQWGSVLRELRELP